MKRTSILIFVALTFAGLQVMHAQGLRMGDRAWFTIRGGLFLGMNQSLHTGDVPLLPTVENNYFTSGSSTNIIFGVHGEKALTRYVSLGLRLTFDQMSGNMDGRYTEAYRIADDNGTLYSVVRDHEAKYTLQYLSIGMYTKLYPLSGPGFFVLGGAGVGTLMKGDYSHVATIAQPDWARGAESPTISDGIPDANDLRYSAQLGFGYDFWFRYGLVTPILSYEFALNPVSQARFADSWNVDNLRFLVELTFPIP